MFMSCWRLAMRRGCSVCSEAGRNQRSAGRSDRGARRVSGAKCALNAVSFLALGSADRVRPLT